MIFGPALSPSDVAWGAAQKSGKTVSVSGKVLVRKDGAAASDLRQLKVGDSVEEGDVINTSSTSSVKFLMSDRSILDIGPSTLFKIAEYQLKNGADRTITYEMDYGKVRAAVNAPVGALGRFRMKTKSATMGVRGTEFVVASELPADPGSAGEEGGASAPKAPPSVAKTEVTVITGKVGVQAGGAQGAGAAGRESMVGANQKLVAQAVLSKAALGVASPISRSEVKVESVSSEELKSTMQSAKLEDQTFKNAIVIDDTGNNTANSTTIAEAMNGVTNTMPEGFNPVQDWGFVGAEFQNNSFNNPVLPLGSTVGLTVIFNK